MDRENARITVKGYLESYLQSKGISTRKPFCCLNPDHPDTKPSMSYDRRRNKCHCFSCGADYDVIDLIKIDYGLSDDKSAFEQAYEMYGISVESPDRLAQARKAFSDKESVQNQPKTGQTIEDLEEPAAVYDFKETVEMAHQELLANAGALAYLETRGISAATIEKYKLGYDNQGYNHLLKAHPQMQSKGKKQHLYKYVLPYINPDGTCNYFLTEIIDRTQIDDYNGKYRKISGIKAYIFNEHYLKENTPEVIFICEGYYDALSVEEAGGRAIAFVGTAHRRFLSLCKKYSPKTRFIICLDNDEAGLRAVNAVCEGLNALNIPYEVRAAVNGKDANESLVNDRQQFIDDIQDIIGSVKDEAQQAEAEVRQAYLDSNTANCLSDFLNGIKESVNTPYIPTGFRILDEILDGGLYEGLYIIGAISSLGKTTFTMQIADQIAQQGKDVIIFSLEMARMELISKSVSRLTLLECVENKTDLKYAKTSRGITTGKRYSSYSQDERDLITGCVQKYGEYAKCLYIREGVGDIGITEITDIVKQHIFFTGNVPVIVIDYLQILAPYDMRATDKQNTDKAVLELKRLSRDYKTPVIGISSLNRQNYNAPISMEAFKESGAIEYSADVLIGLQAKGAGEKNFDVNEAKRKNPREIDLKILKNRNGATGDSIGYEYYTMFNYFKEKGRVIPEFEEAVTGPADKEGWRPVASGKTPFDGQ